MNPRSSQVLGACRAPRVTALSPFGSRPQAVSPAAPLQSAGADDEDTEFDQACFVIERDADFIACAPASLIARNIEWIRDARERLNDALAKAERLVA